MLAAHVKMQKEGLDDLAERDPASHLIAGPSVLQPLEQASAHPNTHIPHVRIYLKGIHTED